MALGMPARERLEAYAVKAFTTQHEFLLERTKRLGFGAGMVNLSIDDSRPVFTVDEVNDSRVRIRVHKWFRRLGVATSCRATDGTDAKKVLKLRTKHQAREHSEATWDTGGSWNNTRHRIGSLEETEP